MAIFLDELDAYLKSKPQEEIQAEWDKTAGFDQAQSPTALEFIELHKQFDIMSKNIFLLSLREAIEELRVTKNQSIKDNTAKSAIKFIDAIERLSKPKPLEWKELQDNHFQANTAIGSILVHPTSNSWCVDEPSDIHFFDTEEEAKDKAYELHCQKCEEIKEFY